MRMRLRRRLRRNEADGVSRSEDTDLRRGAHLSGRRIRRSPSSPANIRCVAILLPCISVARMLRMFAAYESKQVTLNSTVARPWANGNLKRKSTPSSASWRARCAPCERTCGGRRPIRDGQDARMPLTIARSASRRTKRAITALRKLREKSRNGHCCRWWGYNPKSRCARSKQSGQTPWLNSASECSER